MARARIVEAVGRAALETAAAALSTATAAAQPAPSVLSDETLATAVRYSLELLAAKAPGGAVEVRVPPYGVVQCISGGRHTRGTPPNVVETNPSTWIALVCGQLDWSVARAKGRLSASGTRADLSSWLPLITRLSSISESTKTEGDNDET